MGKGVEGEVCLSPTGIVRAGVLRRWWWRGKLPGGVPGGTAGGEEGQVEAAVGARQQRPHDLGERRKGR